MSTRIANRSLAMRKEPRQSRSRVTVEAILDAGARILSDEGWAAFTTNRVAEVAGVSIGSLYQYFPDKLSLVDAIRSRHLGDSMAVLRGAQADALSPSAFAVSVVRGMIAAHSRYPGLHRVLLDEAPATDDYRDPDSEFEVAFLGLYAKAIASCRKGAVTTKDREAARILSDAIDGVIHNAARRGTLGDPAVASGLVRLVSLYLGDASASPPGPVVN
ncbi:TetR/AcrR family transcriptional regulator [Shinella sp. NM-101]|uniref:TetR/AcrR family transcriptional regulator n=1 Tax=Shinella sp. NM-101 TaxID=2744455 RepID=UPI001F3CB4A1|nr:TetR/AcrR family transcriptional regulator [Shinella sp. NM-101]